MFVNNCTRCCKSKKGGASKTTMNNCTIDISQASPLEYQTITIIWPIGDVHECSAPNYEDFKVEVKGKTFSISAHYREADNTDWTVSVCMGSEENIDQFVDLLARVVDKGARIDQVWRLDILDPGHHHGQWTDILRILISYWDERIECRGWDGKEYRYFHQMMPEYINFEGEEIKLEYLYRLPWCEHCKSNAETFHEIQDCPHRDCLKCKKIQDKVQKYGDQECDTDSDFDADDVSE